MEDQDNRHKGETAAPGEIILDEDGLPLNEEEDEFWESFYDDEDEEDDEDYGRPAKSRSVLLRLVALITVLSFLGLVAVTSVPVFRVPLAGLISRSLQLEKDIDIQKLQAAVVEIDVVARKHLGVVQKSGTGFNIDSGGVIVTNNHVIEGAHTISIRFPDGSIFKADHWSAKPEMDLAVISLRGDGLPTVPLDISGLPRTGERIRVVGNPLGLNSIVADGKVVQYLRLKNNPERVFSIDAPIFPGNSGSPVFNREGKVIGVVFASWKQAVDGREKVLGLAIPVEEVLELQKKF